MWPRLVPNFSTAKMTLNSRTLCLAFSLPSAINQLADYSSRNIIQSQLMDFTHGDLRTADSLRGRKLISIAVSNWSFGLRI